MAGARARTAMLLAVQTWVTAGACPRFITPTHLAFQEIHSVDASRALAAAIRDGDPSVRFLAAIVMQEVYVDPACLAAVVREDACGPGLGELVAAGNRPLQEAVTLLLEDARLIDVDRSFASGREIAVLILGGKPAGDSLVSTVIDEALRDVDPMIRAAAVASADASWGPRLVAVAWATRDPDARVREQACTALGFSGVEGRRFREELLIASRDFDPAVRRAAIEALDLLGEDVAVLDRQVSGAR